MYICIYIYIYTIYIYIYIYICVCMYVMSSHGKRNVGKGWQKVATYDKLRRNIATCCNTCAPKTTCDKSWGTGGPSVKTPFVRQL